MVVPMAVNPFRNLPAVNQILEVPALAALAGSHAHEHVVNAVRGALAEFRGRLADGTAANGSISPEAVAACAIEQLARESQLTLRPVINATGIVLHTNLGRAPIAD